MNLDPTLGLIIIILLLLLQSILKMSKIAILTARKIGIHELFDKENNHYKSALRILTHTEPYLTMLHASIILVMLFIGYLAVTLLEPIGSRLLSSNLSPVGSAEFIAAIVILAVLGFLCIILGDRIPRQVATHKTKQVLVLFAPFISFIFYLVYPLLKVVNITTQVLCKLLGLPTNTEYPVTEEEIKVLIEKGTLAGTFEEAEQDIVERVFRLADRKVSLLMTPRHDVIYIDLDDSQEANRDKIRESKHSRFPLVQGDLDNIIGVWEVKEQLYRYFTGQSLDFKASAQMPLFVPENVNALNLLELFKQSRTHIAFVVDEYGSFQGLITLKDILEAIVGDIPSKNEVIEPLVIKREDGSWLIDGMLLIEDLKVLLEVNKLPKEEDGGYQTLAGFIITCLGRIPSIADHFVTHGWRFEVIAMDGNRVDKVLVMKGSINEVIFNHP
ncbi:MAG: hypothetical protein K0S74_966 [Chlamydiales bacterium]|jgi:putative hemolysin|nr:hypothetical protein [Chlamydiales bacterium]